MVETLETKARYLPHGPFHLELNKRVAQHFSSTGGVAIMATLAASASYIAAPTAMRIAVPQANAALSITAALGITFPFNVIVGIPLYLKLAQALA